MTSPITLGHEFSGKIVALGDVAKDHFMVGDKVAVDPNRYINSYLNNESAKILS